MSKEMLPDRAHLQSRQGETAARTSRRGCTTALRVVAVEPAEAMRRLLAAHSPQAETLAGNAHEIPLADESVDAAINASTESADARPGGNGGVFFASMGWLADLPDAKRIPLLDEVRSRLITDEYQRLWETYVYWTRRARGQ
jgi:hypothetical protein